MKFSIVASKNLLIQLFFRVGIRPQSYNQTFSFELFYDVITEFLANNLKL